MKSHALAIFALILFSPALLAQPLYFPPLDDDEWETYSLEELDWCEENVDPLCSYLESKNTKAFLVLKDGKIVIEKYFDTFTKDSVWYWASAGKCITSVLTGVAQQEGDLDLTDMTSDYLGEGWTSCTPEQENNITIWNQLTMTSGLDDEVDDIFCTDSECLLYEADPGTRWAYHNGPYTLLDGVLNAATGLSLNLYCNLKLEAQTGMSGAFVPLDYNNVYFSQPRDMARFGLMVLNNGSWESEAILTDSEYFDQMVNTSQDINKSYGYLWWLNGKESFMLPQSQTVFDGPAFPNAPNDMISALGKNGQILNVVPSQNLIVIRMGNNPGGTESLVPTLLTDNIWEYLNDIICAATLPEMSEEAPITIYPNPSNDIIHVKNTDYQTYRLFNGLGQEVTSGILKEELTEINIENFPSGTYQLILSGKKGEYPTQIVKQ